MSGCSNRCNGPKCKLCKNSIVIQSATLPGGPGNSNTECKLSTQQDCNSPNGIYGIRCEKCHKIYIGETGMSFRDRINVHLSNVRLNKPTPVGIDLTGEENSEVKVTKFNSPTLIAKLEEEHRL